MHTVAWIVALVITGAALWQGRLYRVGRHRGFLVNYRNAGLPEAPRNGSLVLELVGQLATIRLVATAPLALVPTISIHRHFILGLFLMVVGYLLVIGGVAAVLTYWLPVALIPDWLVRDDASVGWSPRSRDLTDRLILVFGLASLIGGAVLVTVGGGFILAPAAFGIGA